MQKIKLTGIQRYKLFSFIERNKEVATKSTSEELAKQATLDLGFEVTPNHAGDARLQLGIRKQVKQGSHDRLRVVCRHLQELYTALGLQVPEDFKKIRAGEPL